MLCPRVASKGLLLRNKHQLNVSAASVHSAVVQGAQHARTSGASLCAVHGTR